MRKTQGVRLSSRQEKDLAVFHDAYSAALAGEDFPVVDKMEGPRAEMARVAYFDVANVVSHLSKSGEGVVKPHGGVIIVEPPAMPPKPEARPRPWRRVTAAAAAGLVAIGGYAAYEAASAVPGLFSSSSSPSLNCSRPSNSNQLYEGRFPTKGGDIVVSTPDGPLKVVDHMGKLALVGGPPAPVATQFSPGEWIATFVSTSGEYDVFDGLATFHNNGNVTWHNPDNTGAVTMVCDGYSPPETRSGGQNVTTPINDVTVTNNNTYSP